MKPDRARALEHYAAQLHADVVTITPAALNQIAADVLKNTSPGFAAIRFAIRVAAAAGATNVPDLVDLIDVARDAA